MAASNLKRSYFGEELFRKNEIKTNKVASTALLFLGILYAVMTGLSALGVYELISPVAACLMFAAGALDIAVYVCGRKKAFEGRSLKWFVLASTLVSAGVVFFFYPLSVSFLMFCPVILSAMYYDEKLIRINSVLSWALYTALLWGNVILEKYSPLMQRVHEIQDVTVWRLPDEVLFYRYLPTTVCFYIVFLICRGIARSGISLVTRQADLAAEMSSIETQLEIASDIQRSSVPATEYASPGGEVTIEAVMRPAKIVGGDFYDYFTDGKRFAFLIADVSDKGLSAAMFMMKAKNAVRLAVLKENDMDKAVSYVNRVLCADNDGCLFVTLWAGVIDLNTGEGRYVNCGHSFPVIRHADGTVGRIENEPNLVLGVFEDACAPSRPLKLGDGDTLVLFTDGFTDALNRDGNAFGEQGFVNAVKGIRNVSGICAELAAKVDAFAGDAEQFDDMTALALTYRGAASSVDDMFSVSIPGDGADVLIDRANALLLKKDCPEEAPRDIDTALDEVYVKIDGCLDSSREFLVSLRAEEGLFTGRISYGGEPFNPLTDPSGDGLGTEILGAVTDSAEFKRENGTNTLTVKKSWN